MAVRSAAVQVRNEKRKHFLINEEAITDNTTTTTKFGFDSDRLLRFFIVALETAQKMNYFCHVCCCFL